MLWGLIRMEQNDFRVCIKNDEAETWTDGQMQLFGMNGLNIKVNVSHNYHKFYKVVLSFAT